MRWSLSCLLLGALVACDTGEPEVRRARVRPDPPQEGAAPGHPQVAADSDPKPDAPVRVRYDLSSHLARAELRQDQALWIDFGVPGGAKYTLGGWQTGFGEDRQLDGVSVAMVPGETARLLVPGESSGPTRLDLRARAFRDGRLTIYVDGEAAAHATLPADGFGTVSAELPAGMLGPGEHVLQLRVPSVGRTGDGTTAGLALDWVRLAPSGTAAPGPGAAPPSPSALTRAEGGVETLRLREGLALGYAFEVVPGARLRGVVRGNDGAVLRVLAHEDDGTSREVARVGASTRGGFLDADLTELSGRVVRVDLRAEKGELALLRPAVVTPGVPREVPEADPPRHVLVYLVDTLRADKLKPFDEGTRVETPGLEAYVKHAAVFETAHSPAPWTKPSVATLLSGLMPWQHKATRGESVVPRSVKLLSEVLGEKGFFTGAFIANGYVSGKFGFERGWDTWRNYIREGRRTPAEFVAGDVVEWLDRRPDDKPFFLYVHTIDPHVPYIPPDEVLQRYDSEPYHGRVSFVRDRLLLEKVKGGKIRLRERDKARLEALHDAEISYHDEHFANIMAALEERGLADDTLVVITSDHGEEFFDHGSVGHGHSVYEELLHVPLVVRFPGLTDGGVRVTEPVGIVDVMPTVFEALGEPVPEDLAGRSLLPLLRGEGDPAPRFVVSGFHDGWRAALVGRFKLIQRTWQHPSLYDLGSDPDETQDVAADRPITLRYLRGALGLALAGSAEEEGEARARPARRRRRAAPEHQAEATEIDPETAAQLRALGYVH